jgi:argininosuccinate lyase
MPQKKNPDVFELTRGKARVLIGQLTGLLATLKSLPSTYDKDLEEDKAPLFTATDILLAVLPVMTGALQSILVHDDRMRAAIDSAMMATDLADYLVDKGLPFRETHTLASKIVHLAGEKGVDLAALPLDDYRMVCPLFEQDVYRVFDPLESVRRRKVLGGTAPEAVKSQLAEAKRLLATCP